MVPSTFERTYKNRRPRLSWAVGLLLIFFAAPSYSQSLGDVARQERARKMNQPHVGTHVYTNDDLARPQILVPEDQTRVQPKENPKPADSQPAVESAGNEPQQIDRLPLGDIARHYRALKEAARKAEPPSLAPPSALSTPSLAFPKFDQPIGRIASPPPVRITPNTEPADKVIPSDEITTGSRIEVRSGDTLWGLAKKYLGRGEDWMLLAIANPQFSDPSRIRVGTWVHLPEKSQALRPPASVRIKQGDTLWKLTQVYFGNSEAWRCLAQANPQIRNTNLIFVGQTLTIPSSCGGVSGPRTPNLSVSSKVLPSFTSGTP